MSFSALGLSVSTQRVAAAVRYTVPTPIQKQAIPFILEGKDVVAQARTGTGKTAAFALPILQLVSEMGAKKKMGHIRALVLAPTRDLARQVTDSFELFGQYMPREIRAASLIGGEDLGAQLRRLRSGVEILVATPGRLLELVREEKIHFDDLRFLVIDEADRLLDLGFAEEVDLLMSALPAERQTLLFSATFPDKVMKLAERVMQNPVRVHDSGEAPTVETISQRIIEVNRLNRGPLLRHLIKTEAWKHVLIFVGSKRAAHNLAAKLKLDGIDAEAFHGDLDQEQRNEVLMHFKNRNIAVLVATDLAARGIDIQNLSHVVNYDLPRSPVDYIHRIGRTGRAGSKGIAVSFVGPDEQAHFQVIAKRTGLRVEREQVAGFERTEESPVRKKGLPPVKGARPSKKDKARAAAQARKNTQSDI